MKLYPSDLGELPLAEHGASPLVEPSSLDDGEQVGSATIPVSRIAAANVATIPHRSPLRYPGGKTWLIPHIRHWLSARSESRNDSEVPVLFEPFCGGGIVSLTAVMEGLADRCVLAELDHDVAAYWHCALHHTEDLRRRILGFKMSRENVLELIHRTPENLFEHGFRTLVLNRTRRGGILAPGATLLRQGERRRGLISRWYPETIAKRLDKIGAHAEDITFCEADGLKLLESMTLISGVSIFADPPYTAGPKRAAERLYTHHEVDHVRLFELLADSKVDFLLTYAMTDQIVDLIEKHRFSAVQVTALNAHHANHRELVVTPHPIFLE